MRFLLLVLQITGFSYFLFILTSCTKAAPDVATSTVLTSSAFYAGESAAGVSPSTKRARLQTNTDGGEIGQGDQCNAGVILDEYPVLMDVVVSRVCTWH